MAARSVDSDTMTPEMLALVPGASEWDIANLIAARQEKGEKFTPADIFSMEAVCRELAERYARAYSGNFSFMLDMKVEVRRRMPTINMVTGIINALYNDLRGLQIRAEKEAAQARFDANTVIDEGGPTDVQPTQAVVEDGYYTFSFEDGTHLTVRVRVKGNEPAVQKIAALIGPDNENDYQPFGFLKGTRYVPFSAYRKGYDRWHFVARALLGLTDEQRQEAGMLYAQKSGNCMKCGHVLTDPVSIALGIGPVCRGER